MLHVKQIRTIVESGDGDQAHQALDQLLALGPNNLEALKLRASLFESEGRFTEESRVWERVATVDKEDPDAVAYLLRRQVEDREHFYFTDDVPGGGRRFLAYPRQLINFSALGLAGCVLFLMTTKLAAAWPVLGQPDVMLGLFGVLVICPWVLIVHSYIRGVKAVTVSSQGVAIATRLRSHVLSWPTLDRVCLARAHDGRGGKLSLVFVPKDPRSRAFEVDLTQASSSIRARTYLVREVSRNFREPLYVRRDNLALGERKLSRY